MHKVAWRRQLTFFAFLLSGFCKFSHSHAFVAFSKHDTGCVEANEPRSFKAHANKTTVPKIAASVIQLSLAKGAQDSGKAGKVRIPFTSPYLVIPAIAHHVRSITPSVSTPLMVMDSLVMLPNFLRCTRSCIFAPSILSPNLHFRSKRDEMAIRDEMRTVSERCRSPHERLHH